MKTVLGICLIYGCSVFAAGQSGGTGGIQRDPVTGCLMYDGVPAANCPANTSGKTRHAAAVPPAAPLTPLLIPHTPAGSDYMNALQGFLSVIGSKRPSTLGPVEPMEPVRPLKSPDAPPLVDADTFASAGKDLISQNMDDLLDHCPEAVQYVESKSGLLGDFDKVFSKYRAVKDGLGVVKKAKEDLLNDTWWARSSGPDVAREVKFICNGIEDTLGMISPQGKVVNTLREMSDITEDQEFVHDLVGETAEGVDMIKSAYERKDDVNRLVQKVAADEVMLLGKHYIKKKGLGRFVPFIEFGEHLQERAETEEAGIKFKVEVQHQLHNLDTQINMFQNQSDDYVQTIEAMNALHDAVIGVCVQKSIAIGNGTNQ